MLLIFGIDDLVIVGVFAAVELGRFLWDKHIESVNEERLNSQARRIEADADQTKYKNEVMNLKQFNAALEVQKRGILLDQVETIEADRKKKYKNHGSPVGHA